MKAVNPFIPRMSDELQNEFMEYLSNYVKEVNDKDNANKSYEVPYEIIFIVVRKSCNV